MSACGRDGAGEYHALVIHDLNRFFGDIRKDDYRVMIEFVKDGSKENLFDDAFVLKKIICP